LKQSCEIGKRSNYPLGLDLRHEEVSLALEHIEFALGVDDLVEVRWVAVEHDSEHVHDFGDAVLALSSHLLDSALAQVELGEHVRVAHGQVLLLALQLDDLLVLAVQ
jgi:hypothetical protein